MFHNEKALKNTDVNEIYETLIIKDIMNAADEFRPVYEVMNKMETRRPVDKQIRKHQDTRTSASVRASLLTFAN